MWPTCIAPFKLLFAFLFILINFYLFNFELEPVWLTKKMYVVCDGKLQKQVAEDHKTSRFNFKRQEYWRTNQINYILEKGKDIPEGAGA